MRDQIKSLEDINEYRLKTISRLVDKRRHYQNIYTEDVERQKQNDAAFRSQRKQSYKESVNQKVLCQVDKHTLNDTIKNNPEIILSLKSKNACEKQNGNWDPLDGLVFESDSVRILSDAVKADSLLLVGKKYDIVSNSTVSAGLSTNVDECAGHEVSTQTRKPGFSILSTEMSPTATHFLQSSVTFGLTIRDRISTQSSVNYKNTLRSPRNSFEPVHKPPIRVVGTLELKDSEVHTQPTTQLSEQNRMNTLSFSTYDNASQATDLMCGLLLPDTLSAPVKTVGLMAKFLRPSGVSGVNRQQVSGPAGMFSPLQRTQSFVQNYLSAGSGGLPRGSVGTSTPALQPTLSSATLSDPSSESKQSSSSNLFCSLADSVFLIGASRAAIYEQVTMRTENGTISSFPTVNHVADPSILFMTECDNPAEMLSLLPSYCFPSGVELSVASAVQGGPASTKNQQKGLLQRKNSSLVSAVAVPQSTTAIGSKKSNKLRPFFPSDFSIKDAPQNAPTTAPIARDGIADPKLLKSSLQTSPRAPFVLMFGDHTYQQYCLGLQLPMTFHDAQNGVVVHTSYVLCMMTKLPLFNFLFHVLEQFEQTMKGFKFSAPFSPHDDSFPVPPELRALNDLASRLKRTTVPLYPFLVSKYEDNSHSAVYRPDEAAPSLFAESEFTALLPNTDFQLVSRTVSSAKIEESFPRSFFQSYFSDISMPFDPANPALRRLVSSARGKEGLFTPNAVHRSQQEKENTFHVLLWALPVLLRYLPLDQIILALGCAVSEMRIVVKHKDFHVISSVILALLALLKPLKWCSPVIVILPDSLAEFVESPVPIIIGLQNLPDGFVLLERFVVIDPQERIVHLNPTDVVVAHTILLPHASKLVNVLRAPTDTILRLTRKRKAGKPKKVVLVSATSSLNVMDFQGAADDGAHGATQSVPFTLPLAPSVPLPIELDVGTTENTQLLGAVRTFSSLVANHIEAIINTAIQRQHEELQLAKDKRRQLTGSKVRNTARQSHGEGGAERNEPKAAPLSSNAPETMRPPNSSYAHDKPLSDQVPQSPLALTPVRPVLTPVNESVAGPLSASPHLPQAVDSLLTTTVVSDEWPALPDNSAHLHEAHFAEPLNKPRSKRGGQKDQQRHSLPPSRSAARGGGPNGISVKPANGRESRSPVPTRNKRSSLGETPPRSGRTEGVRLTPPRFATKEERLSPLTEVSRVSRVINAYEASANRRKSNNGGHPPVQSHKPSSSSTDSGEKANKSDGNRHSLDSAAETIAPIELAAQESENPQILSPSENTEQVCLPAVVCAASEEALAPWGGDMDADAEAANHAQPVDVRDDCSDITFLENDLQGSPFREQPRTGSDKSSSGASVSSTSSSLPSLQLGAPVLSIKEIGQGGAKFVTQLLETQMFCNYCQNAKVESSLATHKLHKELPPSVTFTNASQDRSRPEEEAFSAQQDLTGDMSRAATPSLATRGRTRSHSRALSLSCSAEADSGGELDSLQAVFEVMLTGSVSMEPLALSAAKDTYRALYPDGLDLGTAVVSRTAALLTRYSSELERAAGMSAEISSAVCDGYFLTQQGTDFPEAPNTSSAGSYLAWCNGLQCGGKCNTPACSAICLTLWQRSVQKLRQETVVQDIINRHLNSAFIAQQRVLKVPASGRHGEFSTVRVSLKPKPVAVRHAKETESQFQQRQSIIATMDEKLSTHKAAPLAKNPCGSHGQKAEEKVRGPNVSFKRTGDSSGYSRKRMTYARSSTADAATLLLARHYADKQRKIIVQRRKRALQVLKRFLLRFVFFFRKIKFIDSVVRLQAFARGYIIRCHIAAIVEALIARKIERLLACIRIRNFFRAYATVIARRWARRKIDELRKKRQLLSLPAASTASPPMTSGSSEKLWPTASHKSIRDSDQDGSLVSSLYDRRAESAADIGSKTDAAISSTTAPSVLQPLMQGRASMPAVLRSRSVASGLPSKLNTLFEQLNEDSEGAPSPATKQSADTSLIDKLNASYNMMRRPSLNEQPQSGSLHSSSLEHPVGPIAAVAAAAKKFSPRTYSEKAKEFLQFGKILHRTSSALSTPRRSTIYSFHSKTNLMPSAPAPSAAPDSASMAAQTSESRSSGTQMQRKGVEHLTIVIKSASSDSDSLQPSMSAGGSDSESHDAMVVVPSTPSAVKKILSDDSLSDEVSLVTEHLPLNSRTESNSSMISSTSRHTALSPTSGIPLFSCEYNSSGDEEDSEHGDAFLREKRKSLRSSFTGRKWALHNSNYISGGTSNFASQVIELRDSGENLLSTGDFCSPRTPEFVGEEQTKLLPPYLVEGETDARSASVVSRLLSSTEARQPTALSALPRRVQDHSVPESAAAAVSTPPFEHKRRHSHTAGRNAASGMNLLDAAKKQSPIGRYAAQNNYDISKIVNTSHYDRGGLMGQLPPLSRQSTSPASRSQSSVAAEFAQELREEQSAEPTESTQVQLDLRDETLFDVSPNSSTNPFEDVRPQEKLHFDSRPTHLLVQMGSVNESVFGSSASSATNEDQLPSKRWSGLSSESEAELAAEESEEEEEELDEPNVDDDLTQELRVLPLRTLGSNVLEYLNRQQLQTIKTMWGMLRGGVEVLKHGRKGKPKFKTLFCDLTMTKLYWRVPGSRPDADLDDSDPDTETNGSGGLAHGVAGLIPSYHHGKQGGGRRSSYIKTNADRLILFKEILEVREDFHTEVMQRSLAKQYISGNTCVISIVMADRTLDFEIREAYWGAIYHSLQILTTFYQSILPSNTRGRSNSTTFSPRSAELVSESDKDFTANQIAAVSDLSGSTADAVHPSAAKDHHSPYIALNRLVLKSGRRSSQQRATAGVALFGRGDEE